MNTEEKKAYSKSIDNIDDMIFSKHEVLRNIKNAILNPDLKSGYNFMGRRKLYVNGYKILKEQKKLMSIRSDMQFILNHF